MVIIARREDLLGAIANGVPSNIKPLTREERYLVAIANGDDVDMTPLTRTERLLQDIIDHGGAGAGGGLKFDTGTFTFVEDTAAPTTTTIQHNLGIVPDIVVVWTNDFSRATESNPLSYNTATMVGGSLLKDLTKLPQTLSSTYDARVPITNVFTIGANGYKVSYAFTNTSYGFTVAPTEAEFTLPYHASNTFWRSGVTYRFLVAKGVW